MWGARMRPFFLRSPFEGDLPLTLRFEQKRSRALSDDSDLLVGKREIRAASASLADYMILYATRIRAARRYLWARGVAPWDFRQQRKATPH